ncbi:helicase associated domain-containing protein [Streptomyces sp. NPDC056512]|uniref:helicase associated domain-containing protein n=1 Tax=unclassified Streptomyces TaxID=2593676 RepID=UPI0036A01612
MGIWLKNARAAARKAQEIEQPRAEGLPVQSAAGALSDERREQLKDIDPSWCPAWPVEWQRAFHLVQLRLHAGGAPPTESGDVVHQGVDLGRWVRVQRLGWDKLTTVQQWMCVQVLGIEPAAEDEKPPARRTQADKWAMNYEAAKQFYQREGHLRVPRKHVARIAGEGVGEDQEERELRLGARISNQRSRAATLPRNGRNNSPASACAGHSRRDEAGGLEGSSCTAPPPSARAAGDEALRVSQRRMASWGMRGMRVVRRCGSVEVD